MVGRGERGSGRTRGRRVAAVAGGQLGEAGDQGGGQQAERRRGGRARRGGPGRRVMSPHNGEAAGFG